MSKSSIQPLNIGSIVTAGIRLYRYRFQEYFPISLQAFCWLLVPIYGWVKFYALTTLISRLAFGELVNQPEGVSAGKQVVNSRLWHFFVNMLLMLLITIVVIFGLTIAGTLLTFIPFMLLGGLELENYNPNNLFILGLIIILVMLIALVAVLWILSRLYLVDISLAVEDNINGSSSINRSWELTQGNVGRIILIGIIAFLITLPLQIFIQIITTSLQFLANTSSPSSFRYSILSMSISLFGSAFIIPFTASIKAAVYYDLRIRREGLGLQLRNHDI